MSNHQQQLSDDGIPGFEPWLGVAAASLVPAALALFVPAAFLVPLIAATVGLITLSGVMWWRQSNRPPEAEP
jgi:hypothetical protein